MVPYGCWGPFGQLHAFLPTLIAPALMLDVLLMIDNGSWLRSSRKLFDVRSICNGETTVVVVMVLGKRHEDMMVTIATSSLTRHQSLTIGMSLQESPKCYKIFMYTICIWASTPKYTSQCRLLAFTSQNSHVHSLLQYLP